MRVDISIVLYNPDWSLFEQCLSSIKAQLQMPGKVWVLLSDADDEDLQRLGRIGEPLQDVGVAMHIFVRCDNLGFAQGHNFLADRAFASGADALVVLNPDVNLDVCALDTLQGVLASRPNSLLGLRLLLGDRSDSTGQIWKLDSLGIVWTRDGRHMDGSQGHYAGSATNDVITVDGVTGACLAVTKRSYMELVNRTGEFFDEAFLAYREDAELGIRASVLGIENLIVDRGNNIHFRGSPGTMRGNVTVDALSARNRFLLRWKLGSARPGHRALPTLRDLIVIVAVLLVERRSLPALRECLRFRRTMLHKRHRLFVESVRASPKF